MARRLRERVILAAADGSVPARIAAASRSTAALPIFEAHSRDDEPDDSPG